MYVALLALNVALFALLVGAYLRTKACSLFHPLTIYLAFHGLVFVVRPVLSWYYGYRLIYQLYQFSPDDTAKAMALIAANVGVFSFAAASLYWGGEPFRNRFDRFAAMELKSMTTALWLVCLILVPLIGWSLYGAWSLRSSDLASLVLDPATGTTINTGGNGYAQSAYIMGVTLIPLLAWAGGFRWWSLVPALAFALLQAGSGVRGPVVSEIACLGLLYLYSRHRKWLDWRTTAIVLAIALLFGSVGADRGQRIRSLLTNDQATLTLQDQTNAPLEGMDLGNLEYLEFLTDKVPRSTGSYEYFVDNLQVFTEPIPRVLWKDKPIGQPIRFFYLFDYGFPIGMTRSLPGEGWAQLGLLGVAIWCGMWGALLGWLYTAYARSRQSILQTACYMSFLATLIVFYRDGLLMSLLKQGMFFLLPLLLWAFLSRGLGADSAVDLRRLAVIRLSRRERQLAERSAPSGEGAAPTRSQLRSRRRASRALAGPR